MQSAWICEQNLAYSSNFQQCFWQKLWKILQILWRIFQVRFTFHSVTHFCCDYIFTTNITAISMLLTKCEMWSRPYSLPPVFKKLLLLTIYVSRYLQFVLNAIMYHGNYIIEHLLLEDYGIWKWKLFSCAIFVFPNLDAFPDKTDEKTCSIYNIFSKLISNCRCLTSFTIWIASPE